MNISTLASDTYIPMSTMPSWLAKYDALLSPLAVKHETGLGREATETDDQYRSRFTVDDGRIRFSKAFNALNGKTQVFTTHTNEHVRTRLTHSYQVASLSQSIARYLGLNEDLAHVIGLTHDIGHAPFGHAGQDQLHECLSAYGYSFEHNTQSFRIVTRLEPKNLNKEVLEGLLKHSQRTKVQSANTIEPIRCFGHSLEAQAVNMIDRITYTSHDCQDALSANILRIEDIQKTSLGTLALSHPKGLIRGIMQILIDDFIQSFPRCIAAAKVTTLEDVYAYDEKILHFSPEIERILQEFNEFLLHSFYLHPFIKAQSELGKATIETIFHKLVRMPNATVTQFESTHSYSRYEAIRDYIAGLTDKEASSLAISLPQ